MCTSPPPPLSLTLNVVPAHALSSLQSLPQFLEICEQACEIVPYNDSIDRKLAKKESQITVGTSFFYPHPPLPLAALLHQCTNFFIFKLRFLEQISLCPSFRLLTKCVHWLSPPAFTYHISIQSHIIRFFEFFSFFLQRNGLLLERSVIERKGRGPE